MDNLTLTVQTAPAGIGAQGGRALPGAPEADAGPGEFGELLAAELAGGADPAASAIAELLQLPGAADTETDPAAEALPDVTASDAAPGPQAPIALPLPPAETQRVARERTAAEAPAVPLTGTQGAAKDGAQPAMQAATEATLAAEPAAVAESGRKHDDAPIDLGLAQAEIQTPVDAASAQLASHGLQLATGAPRAAEQPIASLNVAAPVRSEGFGDALSQQVVWMTGKDAEIAELRLDPPDLGPVEVRVKISGDDATVMFASPFPEVREAIEGSLARLREAMAAAGLNLGEASVSHESFREQAQHQGAAGSHGNGGGTDGGQNAEPGWRAAAQPARRGLIDLFA